MKFAGPTSNGAPWQEENTIEITFDSVEELNKNNTKYIRARRSVVRTSSEAKPGDKKELVFHLPDGNSFKVDAAVEKVKEQPGKSYAISLFKLQNLTDDHLDMIKKSLAPPVDDLDMGDDLDIDIPADELPSEKDGEKEEPKLKKGGEKRTEPKQAKEKKKETSKRSEEEEAAVQAMLLEDAPEDEELIEVELPEELKGVSGDLIMPKVEGVEEDPFMEQKKYVVAFILSFTKSVQRSGYYGDSDHPEAVKSKKGLYALFRKIVGRRREVSFIRKSGGDDNDLLIDGVLAEMVSSREIMPRGMADLYVPRFMEYLERRCLISFSVKRVINEDKFNGFIDLMSKFSSEFRDDARKEGERFTKTLVDHGIMEVSAIFDEDIIASGRKLPWQAELTLSRLRKDLKTVPLLKNATEEELRQIKIRIFEDTIRPLRNPAFMIAVLLNADLIMEAIEDNPVLQDINVEEFMIKGAEVEFLAKTSLELIKELEGVLELQKSAALEVQRNQAKKREEALMRIAKHVTERLLEVENPVADDTVEEFYNHKLIPFDSLPTRVQERISNKKLAEVFLKNSGEILERFDSHLSDKEFSEMINRFQRVIPLLSEKNEYLIVSRIIDKTRKYLDDRDAKRKSLARRLFDFIGTTDVLKNLRDAFDSEDKELRGLAATVFVAFGRQSVPMFLDVLKSNDDKWVRKQIIRSLIEIGAPSVQPMINELYKEDNPWFFLRNIVNILGEVGDRKIVGKLTLLLYHENPSVREETVNTLFRISPETAESHLIKMLDDHEPKVREKAIYCLGMMQSQNEKVFNFYMEVLEGKAELENEALQIQVYRAVGKLGKIEESKRKTIESILLGELEKKYGGGLLRFLKQSSSPEVSDSLQMAACTALGDIGAGKKVIKVLENMAKDKDPVLSQRAKEALDKVEKRGG